MRRHVPPPRFQHLLSHRQGGLWLTTLGSVNAARLGVVTLRMAPDAVCAYIVLPCLLRNELPSRSATPTTQDTMTVRAPRRPDPQSGEQLPCTATGLVWNRPAKRKEWSERLSGIHLAPQFQVWLRTPRRTPVAPTAHARLGPAGGSTCPRTRLSRRLRGRSSEQASRGSHGERLLEHNLQLKPRSQS